MQYLEEKRKKDNVWNRVSFFSFALSIVILLQHNTAIHYFDAQIAGNQFSARVIECVSLIIVPIAVPGFMVMSGILFYRNYEVKDTMTKWKTRFSSLLIPYLLWNALYTLMMAIISYCPLLAGLVNSRELFILTPKNIWRGGLLYKYNGVFWYVFDLIVFTLLAPCIYQVIRNKKIGLIAIGLLLVVYCSGMKFPNIVFRHDALLYYMIGAFVGRYYWKQLSEAKCNTKIVLGAMFSFVFMIISKNALDCIAKFAQVVFIVLMLNVIWHCMASGKFSRCYEFHGIKKSFMIYAMHWYLLSVIIKIFTKIFQTIPFGLLISYVGSTIITLVVIVLIATIWEKILPRCYGLFSGQR